MLSTPAYSHNLEIFLSLCLVIFIQTALLSALHCLLEMVSGLLRQIMCKCQVSPQVKSRLTVVTPKSQTSCLCVKASKQLNRTAVILTYLMSH